jgi:hypothetical protein
MDEHKSNMGCMLLVAGILVFTGLYYLKQCDGPDEPEEPKVRVRQRDVERERRNDQIMAYNRERDLKDQARLEREDAIQRKFEFEQKEQQRLRDSDQTARRLYDDSVKLAYRKYEDSVKRVKDYMQYKKDSIARAQTNHLNYINNNIEVIESETVRVKTEDEHLKLFLNKNQRLIMYTRKFDRKVDIDKPWEWRIWNYYLDRYVHVARNNSNDNHHPKERYYDDKEVHVEIVPYFDNTRVTIYKTWRLTYSIRTIK